MLDFKKIATELRNSNTMTIDQKETSEILKLMNDEDKLVAYAIEKEIPVISKIVDAGVVSLQNNGRIIYIGSGTSGRLGVLDAVECPPTFGVDSNVFIGLIAGGEKAFIKAQEGAEDNEKQGMLDLKDIKLNSNDLVIGIAASGRTPYVIGALKYANEIGCKSVSIAITSQSEVAKYANIALEVVVGPEVVTGSTRLKAGTAQKLILNMISTSIMIKVGKVYQNLMVDVQQTNHKLVERAKRIVMEATDCDYETAQSTLELCNGHAKTAIVMILTNSSLDTAEKKLKMANGFIRNTL